MSTGPDEDALRWDGDDDPTLEVGARALADEPAHAPVLPPGFTAVGRGSEGASDLPADTADTPAAQGPTSNIFLVALGIVAGASALYTIGWIVGGLRLQGTAEFLVSPLGYRFAFWLAVIAPAVWFLSALVLTRRAKTWLRLVWMAAGLIVLVPWPFTMVGVIGQ